MYSRCYCGIYLIAVYAYAATARMIRKTRLKGIDESSDSRYSADMYAVRMQILIS